MPFLVDQINTVDPCELSLPHSANSWTWIVDLERTATLLVGRCLNEMLRGPPVSIGDAKASPWLELPLFRNGIRCREGFQLGDVSENYLNPVSLRECLIGRSMCIIASEFVKIGQHFLTLHHSRRI